MLRRIAKAKSCMTSLKRFLETPYVIFFSGALKPTGGPSGYLFNLNNGIAEHEIKNIKMVGYSDVNDTCADFGKNDIAFRILYANSIAKAIMRLPVKLKQFSTMWFHLSRAKIVHFHYSPDFVKISPRLKKGTLKIFTSHSPEPLFSELEKQLVSNGVTNTMVSKLVAEQKEIDTRAFQEADRVVFPCIGAVECYSEFLNSIDFDYSKIDTVLTGTAPAFGDQNGERFRISHNIPRRSKLVLYLGRKTKIKGFDIFISVANSLREHSDIVFLCAGVGEINVDHADNILDLGWVSDPGTLLNACDFVIAPNRATYFDIGILQALAAGKIVLSSATGGNKLFLEETDSDIYLTINNDPLEYRNYIVSLKKLSSERNRALYVKHFSNGAFARNYQRYYVSRA